MTTPTPDAICERLERKIASTGAWMTSDVQAFYIDIRALIQQQLTTIERLSSALEAMMEAYRCEADPYSLGGFHRNLDEDECMVEALAALGETA